MGSISSTFYVQLLLTYIPNAQKRQPSQQCHLALLGPASVKAAHKTLVTLTHAYGAAFMSANDLVLNFFFTNNTGPNFTSTLNWKLLLTFYSICSTLCASKIIVNLLVQKLIIHRTLIVLPSFICLQFLFVNFLVTRSWLKSFS